MNTTVVISSAEPTTLHHLSHQSTKKSTPLINSCNISFNSYTPKSKFSIRTDPRKTRSTTRIHALFVPAETTETMYELLGITENGTFSDIKKAYKQMARKYHPDVSPPDRVDEYATKFIMVHEAYETLSDPKSRAMYDSDLRFGFSTKRTRTQYDHRMEETEQWRMRWESQINELKKRNNENPRGGSMSWGERVRNNKGL